MITQIRNFLCRMNPLTATFVIVIGGLLLVEAIALGIGPFLMIIGIGCIFALCLLAIGVGIYKSICYFQEGCRLRRW